MRKSEFRIAQTQYIVISLDAVPGEHIVAILPDKLGARAYVVGKPRHKIIKHLEYNKGQWLQFSRAKWMKLRPITIMGKAPPQMRKP